LKVARNLKRKYFVEITARSQSPFHAIDTDHGLYFVPETQAWRPRKSLNIAIHESQKKKAQPCRDIRNAAMITIPRKIFITEFTVVQWSISGKKKSICWGGESF
jgi:hypothetical protein